jgi:8-oxo-dGTP pyrophosphatase MutT (NUDIX family)
MAKYMWDTKVYPSDMFVESCGAILFDLSGLVPKVCLLHYGGQNQWLLPKGRRNCNETRQDAAIREVQEESGYACRLRPVTMPTRAPAEDEAADVQDKARVYGNLTEAFMLEVRNLGEVEGVKLVWWFIAELDRDTPPGTPEVHFKPSFFECDEAMQMLTFQKDRDVLRRALDLIAASDWHNVSSWA